MTTNTNNADALNINLNDCIVFDAFEAGVAARDTVPAGCSARVWVAKAIFDASKAAGRPVRLKVALTHAEAMLG